MAYKLDLSPNLVDPLCLPCAKLEKASIGLGSSKGRSKLPSPMVVDVEEEYEVEAILRHKDNGAQYLYLVMWKRHPIT